MGLLLFIVAVMAAFAAFVVWHDTHHFVVSDYRICDTKIQRKRVFAVVSDLHNREFGENNAFLLDAIRDRQPDGILIPGDLNVSRTHRDFSQAEEFLRAVSSEFEIFYSNGNHESRVKYFPDDYDADYSSYARKVEQMGVHYLNNECKEISEDLVIAGLEIPMLYYKKRNRLKINPEEMEEWLGKKEQTQYTILLAHNPEQFQAYAAWGADLVLSGHLHGGIARLPFIGGVISPSYRIFPRYDCGCYEEKNSRMIVSRGLGCHTIPIRFLNPGELIFITLEPTTGD